MTQTLAAPPIARLSGAAALAGGLAVLALLWAGPLPEVARVAFSPHMLLHLGVTVVAAPLVALGLARLAAERFRFTAGAAVAAAALEMAVVWGWHAPGPHEAAALDPFMFWLQQGSFVAAGVFVWLACFQGRGRGALLAGVLGMLLTFMHMSMLGALLALTPELLYAPAVCRGAFGLSPLEDQRLAGGLMAIGGGAPYLVGGLVLAARLLR